MTEPLEPPSDEDLSAALDGEADLDARARIEAHPESGPRSDQLAQASMALRTSSVPDLDDEAVDQLVRTAMDTPIAPAKPSPDAQPARWLVAAVIAVLVGVGLTLVWTGRDDGGEQAFDTVSNSVAEDGAAADEEADQLAAEALAEHSGEASPSADAADAAAEGPLLDLGTFESGDALRQALATATLDEASNQLSTAAGSARTGAVTRCAQQLSVALDLPTAPQAQAAAIVDGTAVLVYEFAIESFEDGQPTTLVAAVDADACAQVVVFER